MKTKNSKKLTLIDLFSGCGGLSFGFLQAGYEVLMGIDNDAISLKTFKENHPVARVLEIDLSKPTAIKEIRRALKRKTIDVIIAGPPCQGFSLTGPRNFNDGRNNLFMAVVSAVKEFKPKAFLIENVPGLVTLYGGKVKDKVIEQFEKLNYKVSWDVLNAADYGVPQFRKRVFVVGLREDVGKFVFPSPTHTSDKYVSCSDAISDLPSRESECGFDVDKYTGKPRTKFQGLMREDCDTLYNHIATRHTETVKKIISQVPDGGDYRDLPSGVGENRKFNEAWTRYNSKKPALTVDTGHRNHFHYKYNRIPTVRENARLQSFPDYFRFYGNRTQQHRQVGNAVPPLLAFHIAVEILRQINLKLCSETKRKSIISTYSRGAAV